MEITMWQNFICFIGIIKGYYPERFKKGVDFKDYFGYLEKVNSLNFSAFLRYIRT